MTYREYLASLRERYNAAYAKAGMQARVADAKGEAFAKVKPAKDGAHLLRIDGPMDDWYGGVDVQEVILALDAADPEELRVVISSPGGLVEYGMRLYDDLRNRMGNGMALSCEVHGICASAAVLPFLAAAKADRTVGESSTVMVHNVWGGFFAVGNADLIEEQAARHVKAMRSLSGTYAKVVAKATGQKRKDVAQAMSEERWYRSEEAVELGYAARVEDGAGDEEMDDERAETAETDDEETMALVARAQRSLVDFHVFRGGER